ncbi:glycosyltransferase family 4 protein [Kallotenue papyrolyticum]|uniref:glycosyltransferase family 4 protein n=1 Tax=Kallotenue papyrolyticum TaxID=1325125 RepID=UPI00047865FC|nr:glycosyltransferase family 4 protein [Kallotenue papyrolyticum]
MTLQVQPSPRQSARARPVSHQDGSNYQGRPRVLAVLVGDLRTDPGARTKYGLFFDALGARLPLLDVVDASLRGLPRVINALLMMHPNPRRWRERFWQNVPAFRARSSRFQRIMRRYHGQVDVIVQVGVLFDARWHEPPVPSVIYTDYTARLAAQRAAAGRSPFTPRQRAQWIAYERQALQRATYVCTRGAFVREAIVADYGLPADRVFAIGGGVNFATLPVLQPRPSCQPPTALFVGKELYRKGGDLLLRAFAQVRRQVPHARLLMVTGDAIPRGLPREGVEVLAPTWDRAAIAALYQRADLFVLPSRLETWGDVLLEAMAYGLPCIGVAGEAMEEIIQHETTGLVVAPDAVDALAAALIRLLTDQDLRARWGRAARQRVEQSFTWERVVERLVPVLQAASAGDAVGRQVG